MRYIFRLILPTLLFQVASAQVVITGDTYTQASDVLYYESASPEWTAATNVHNISGENQTWDITDWSFLMESDETYVGVGDTPFAYQFFFNNEFLYPENYSTHALELGTEAMDLPLPFEVDDPFAFFRNDDQGYYQTGNAFTIEGLPLVTQNDISDRILTFPLEYGNIDSTDAAFITSVPFFGAYGQSGERIARVDGWGEMITPYGTFEVLRIEAERHLVDTIYIEASETGEQIVRPVQFDYMWVSPDVPGPLLEMTVIDGVVLSARMNAGTGIVNTEEQALEGVSIYPNPAVDEIRIDWGANVLGLVRIFDSKGQLVLSQLNAQQLDINELSPGIYFAEVRSEGRYSMQKVVVLAD